MGDEVPPRRESMRRIERRQGWIYKESALKNKASFFKTRSASTSSQSGKTFRSGDGEERETKIQKNEKTLCSDDCCVSPSHGSAVKIIRSYTPDIRKKVEDSGSWKPKAFTGSNHARLMDATSLNKNTSAMLPIGLQVRWVLIRNEVTDSDSGQTILAAPTAKVCNTTAWTKAKAFNIRLSKNRRRSGNIIWRAELFDEGTERLDPLKIAVTNLRKNSAGLFFCGHLAIAWGQLSSNNKLFCCAAHLHHCFSINALLSKKKLARTSTPDRRTALRVYDYAVILSFTIGMKRCNARVARIGYRSVRPMLRLNHLLPFN